MDPAILRKLARDQWVRFHGTPRVTVLVGGMRASAVWTSWAALAARDAILLHDGTFDARVRRAVAHASADPGRAIAVLVGAAELAAWRGANADRVAALVDEGILEVLDPPAAAATTAASMTSAAPTSPELHIDARSAAEAALFEALEATPATAGRFELNGALSVFFGPRAAEIDLIARREGIAIEIDGVHHFGDLDRYRRDRRKDVLMQMQGLFVIRLLAEDILRDARGPVEVVCRVMAHRARERR